MDAIAADAEARGRRKWLGERAAFNSLAAVHRFFRNIVCLLRCT
jgi:hypothetical protein